MGRALRSSRSFCGDVVMKERVMDGGRGWDGRDGVDGRDQRREWEGISAIGISDGSSGCRGVVKRR